MREMDLDKVETNMYKDLKREILARFRHINKGAYNTKDRYIDAMLLLARILIVKYRIRNLRKIKLMHLQYYVNYMRCNGYSESYIESNMSAIRFYYYQATEGSNRIPKNRELGIGTKELEGAKNKTWILNHEDYLHFKKMTDRYGREDYNLIFELGNLLQAYVYEAVSLSIKSITSCLERLEDAKDGKARLKVVNKDGIIRYLDITNQDQVQLLKDIVNVTVDKNKRIFSDHKSIKKVIEELRYFVDSHKRLNVREHSFILGQYYFIDYEIWVGIIEDKGGLFKK